MGAKKIYENLEDDNESENTPKSQWVTKEIVSIRANEIAPDPENEFNRDAININADLLGLEASIKDSGILIPIHVRPLTVDEQERINKIGKNDINYYIIDGERRYRASQLETYEPRLQEIPCIVFKDEKTINNPRVHQTIINLKQRKNIEPWVICKAFKKIMACSGIATQAELCKVVHESKQYVSKVMRLEKLDERIKAALDENRFHPEFDDDGRIRVYGPEDPQKEGLPKIKVWKEIPYALLEECLEMQSVQGPDAAVLHLCNKLPRNDPRLKVLNLQPEVKASAVKTFQSHSFTPARPSDLRAEEFPGVECQISFAPKMPKPNPKDVQSGSYKKKVEIRIPWEQPNGENGSQIDIYKEVEIQLKGITAHLRKLIKSSCEE
ncbi:MAG: ParB N-terminal domain-containing protein [Planctomycetes bacterium]|nr:ParB N-terminal domain-containing protein [Planctomycetota bacterium]